MISGSSLELVTSPYAQHCEQAVVERLKSAKPKDHQSTHRDTPHHLSPHHARFHKTKNIKAKEAPWQDKGLFLRYLPPYSPQLHPIEALWQVLKGFLLPRRLYASLKDLKEAVLSALTLLNAIIL